MKPSQLSELLSKTIQARLPVLIKGAPGIGKTDIVTQACNTIGADLIVSHPVVDEPIDYKGLPFVRDDHAEFLPFGALRRIIEAQRPTVYFLDDLGQAPPSVQAAAMQLLLARRINGHRVSEQVTFIAATNRKQDKAAVSGILEPVKSRFVTIVELEPDVDDWVQWAVSNNMPAELIAFIRFRPNLLFDFAPSVDITNSPCPRTVHHIGRMLELGLCTGIEFEAFAGAAGEGFAAEFLGFLQIYRELCDTRLILVNPEEAEVVTNPATMCAIIGSLARLAAPESMDAMVCYANRLPDEYSVLLITQAQQYCPDIVNTRAYARWAAKHHQAMS